MEKYDFIIIGGGVARKNFSKKGGSFIVAPPLLDTFGTLDWITVKRELTELPFN